jgi:hypothetical protein
LGAVAGLNDPTDVTAAGTRWVGPRGTVLALSSGRFGLFFSGGSCIDNDSDAFHYVGYAESSDLVSWNVINDMNAPIASVAPVTVNGALIPAAAPLVGGTQGWFAGRIYSPSATLHDSGTLALSFAGYHAVKPKDAETDYRSVGRVFLYASELLPPQY